MDGFKKRYPEIAGGEGLYAGKRMPSMVAAAPAEANARGETRGRAWAPSAPGGLGKWQPGGMSL
jgi:hypothetical protein